MTEFPLFEDLSEKFFQILEQGRVDLFLDNWFILTISMLSLVIDCIFLLALAARKLRGQLGLPLTKHIRPNFILLSFPISSLMFLTFVPYLFL